MKQDLLPKTDLQEILQQSAQRHSHLCPRQVLGARASLAAGQLLGLELPRQDKRLLVIAESDGCFIDGIEVATGVSIGRRTLRVEDYGKMAATFIDTATGRAFRIAPKIDVRVKAWSYAPGEKRRYFAMLHGYQTMPDDELFSFLSVHTRTPLGAIISKPGLRSACDNCGEEIVNEREVRQDGKVLCRACAGEAYYIAE